MARSRSRAVAVSIVSGLAMTAVLTWAVHELEERSAQKEFETFAKDRHEILTTLLSASQCTTDEIAALYDASDDVNQGEFAGFTHQLRERLPAIRGCAWCPWIPSLQRPGRVDTARRNGQAALAQRLAAGTGDALPVWFLNDDGSFPWPMGSDLLQDPERRARLLEAAKSRTSVLFGPFPAPAPRGLIIFAKPWFKADAVSGLRSCQGFILTACDLNVLVETALGSHGRERLHMRLLMDDGRLAASNETDCADAPDFIVVHPLPIADRTWSLAMHSGGNPNARWLEHLLSLMFLVSGTLITLALTMGVRLTKQRAAETELLVSERTRELRAKVTEHAQSSAALQRALVDNAMLASAVSSTTTGILIIDHTRPIRPIVFINPALTATYGWTAADAMGRDLRLLFGADGDLALCRTLEDCVARGTPFRGETRLAVKDGTTRWTDLTLTPIHDATGLLRWYVGVLTDIAAQKEAAVSLQHERDLLQRQLGFAQALAQAAQVVMAEDDLHSLLKALAGTVGPALAVDQIVVFEVDFGRRLSVCLAEWDAPGLDVPSIATSFPIELFTQSAHHLFLKRTWIESHDDHPFPTLVTDGAASLLHGRHAARSLLFYPFHFRTDGFTLLVLSQLSERRSWREDEIHFIGALSNLAAVAIEKSRLVRQRRQGEAALRENEARYRAIVEDQSELILRFRPDGGITFANAASCRYWHTGVNGLVGRSFASLLPEGANHDLPRVLAGLTPAHGVHACELALPQADGPPRWLQLTVRTIFDDHQQPVEYQAVCQDITGRHQFEDGLRASEASLRSLISEAPEGIFLCDDNGHILEANPSGCALFGGTREAVMGRDLHELATPDEQAGIEAQLTVTRSGEVANVQRTMMRDDHTEVPCEMITKLLPDGRLLVLLHDVSDRLRVEEHLRRAKDAAEQASIAKSSFLATMSHEIRTPMNGVLGMIDLLLDSPLQPEQREFAETARVSGEHLLDIINDILDFSKIEADRLELESIVFEPALLVEETVSLFAEQAQGKNLELVAIVAADTPHVVRGDPSRLRQVLINLLGNAVKFTDRGEVVVRVGCDDASGIRQAATVRDGGSADPSDEAEPTGETPVRLWFSVTDTGSGIPESSRPRMFQSFSQGDSSTTRRFGGTGLGLAICRRLVELMDGAIDYESSGAGTIFRFHINLQRPAVVEDGALAPAHLRGERVLVLDDNVHCQDYLCQRMACWGLACTPLSDPAATLPALREAQAQGRPFVVALIDMDLPGVDSMALIRAVTTDPELAGMRVIALSTVTRRGPGYDARGAGAVAVLSKPVRSVPLLDALIASAAGVGEAEVEPTAATATTISFAGRVLVAEDNLVNRRLVLAQLQRLGLRADAVATGREALAVLERAEYDLVLMDGQMPDLDGFAATAELRRREGGTRHTIVVALTADALAGDRERFIAAGMDDYLAKPVRITDLAGLLGRWLKPAPAPVTTSTSRETRSVTTHAVRAQATRSISQRMSVSQPAAAPPLDSDGLDRDRINEILADGGMGFLGSLVETFRGDAPRLLGALAAALDAGELQAVVRPVHELKGAAAGLGLAALAQACLALEHAASTGMADTDRLHRELTGRYMNALEALDRIVAG